MYSNGGHPMSIGMNRFAGIAALIVLPASIALAGSAQRDRDPVFGSQQLNEKIRKELVTLPYYGVFDNLAFQVQGNTVTLYGQVIRPSTRHDAEARVKKIEGIDRVINNIQVLPLSSFDDQIRRRVYRAVFGSGGLYRYALGTNPSIHIIVAHGHVTLEGVVDNNGDSNLANIRANGVPGVFSVTNNLRVARGR
jgi:hyperosmotically inducible protein